MAIRIIIAASILLIAILPVSGSTAQFPEIGEEVMKVAEVNDVPNTAQAITALTASQTPGPAVSTSAPAPSDNMVSITPAPAQTTPVVTPILPETQPSSTPLPSATPLPSGSPQPSTMPTPSGTMQPSTPSATPPATTQPSETPPSASPIPPETTQQPTPTPSVPYDPGVISLNLPGIDESSEEYSAFKKEIAEIVAKAEKDSGIKSLYGVFIMDLANGYHYGVNESLTRTDPQDNAVEGYFNSASVIKLFQGYILSDMMRQGELDSAKTYYDQVTGRKFKLPDLIYTMISRSDNNYSNAVLRLVGNKKSNEVLTRLGILDSRIYGEMSGAIGYSSSNNIKKYGTSKRCARLTPRDAGLILYNVYMNRETDLYMKTMNKALLGNIYNTRIPVGVARVSPNYRIAHKTGTNSALGVYNDAGIIYCKRPFILVAFTQSTYSGAGQGFIRDLAEDLTRYFDSKK